MVGSTGRFLQRVGPLDADDGRRPLCRLQAAVRSWRLPRPGANRPRQDHEVRRKARTGKAFNAVAVAAHWACATGEEEAAQ